MLEFRADYNRLVRQLTNSPIMIARANRSALSSVGYWIKGELAGFVRSGGKNWEPVSDITRRLMRKAGGQASVRKRLRSKRYGPYYWLARFARYQVDRDATQVQIGFGKSRAGSGKASMAKKISNLDDFLMAVALRAETGEIIRVTKKMRGYFGWLTGRSFKKSIHTIHIKRRPIFGPVRKGVAPYVPIRYEEKFLKAMDRYWNETE